MKLGLRHTKPPVGLSIPVLPRRDRATLEQDDLTSREGPLDVLARPQHGIAAAAEGVEPGERRGVEAEGGHEVGGNGNLGDAPVLSGTDRNVLASRRAIEGPAAGIEPTAVGDHAAGHHTLAQAPGRLDEDLVGTGHGVAGQEHTRRVGHDERLDQHRPGAVSR